MLKHAAQWLEGISKVLLAAGMCALLLALLPSSPRRAQHLSAWDSESTLIAIRNAARAEQKPPANSLVNVSFD